MEQSMKNRRMLSRRAAMVLVALAATCLAPLPAMADPAAPAVTVAPRPLPVVEPVPVPPPPPPAASRKTVALGAAGIAVAGAISATVLGVLALHDKSTYDAAPTYAGAVNGNNLAAYADGCIALAAAAGITSLVLYLTSSDAPDGGAVVAARRSVAFSVSPVVIAHGGGAGAVIQF
jgi:hypothetical protein